MKAVSVFGQRRLFVWPSKEIVLGFKVYISGLRNFMLDFEGGDFSEKAHAFSDWLLSPSN